MKTQVHKLPIRLMADARRIISLPSYDPGSDRVGRIYQRIVSMSEDDSEALLYEIKKQFDQRHKQIDTIFLENYTVFQNRYKLFNGLTDLKKLVLGALLTKEYSIQSAALFNPSMVTHPDQSGLKKGQKRFVMSLRSIGEGHISSIEFRSGIIDELGNLSVDKASPYPITGEVYELEKSSYKVRFPGNSLLSERVLFPQTKSESVGMEDVRLVLFDDGSTQTYYGTYTAFNGKKISSKIFETKDFLNFKVHTLKGKAATDKGMAVFPQEINGKYAFISRQGGENISIMFSESLVKWREYQLLMEPVYPFEFLQIGNCGSPIKTEKGWLLLTHGVGPMRQYTISAALLDLEDPTKVISRLDRPLIWAEEGEREGYVPNVVYTCGGMIQGDLLYIPYAMSDIMTGFSWLDLNDLLAELEEKK